MARAGMWLAGALMLATGAVAADRKPSAADAPERAADPGTRMICKRFVETGSLVKGYRTCKTKREWQNERDDRRMPGTTSGSCNSGESGVCIPGPN